MPFFLFALGLVWLLPAPAQASEPAPALAEAPTGDDRRPLLYLVEREGTRVYLFGSVHLLREGALPLPPFVEAAYADARALAFELDLDEAQADPQALLARATFQDGQTLSGALDAATYARLDRAFQAAGVPIAALAQMKPWMAALTLSQLQLARAGYTGTGGVDAHFFVRAQADGKPRLALETVDQQLDVFDTLPPAEQAAFVRSALERDAATALDEAVDLWARGDADGLDALLNEGMAESPILHQRILADRNRAWIPQIEAMLAGEPGGNVLVVVGAAHLVGADSVVEMLRQNGHTVTRL